MKEQSRTQIMKKQYIEPNTKIKFMSPQVILTASFTADGASGTIDVTGGTGTGDALAKKHFTVWDDNEEDEQK
jgi:hypothetical protein